MAHRSLEVGTAFLKLGLTAFGGPIAHLAYFRTEFVERRGWLSEQQYGQLLALCQFLPGPASSQMGFCLGLMRAGWAGALVAFVAFTLPSALLLVAFASALPLLSGPLGQAAIGGLKILAFAVVADAVLGMSKKLCPDLGRATIAILAATVILLLDNPFAQLLVVAVGAGAGLWWCRTTLPEQHQPLPFAHGIGLGSLLLTVFFGLLLALPWLAGPEPGLAWLIDNFYRAGAMVFGGGHVVLPLLESAVVVPGGVGQQEFLAGYGAAQAVPGPLFTFAAYLGALLPLDYNLWLLATTALAAIFLPGFLLVAGVLPLWQKLAGNRAAASAVAGINAAVVGLLGAALYDPIFTAGIGSARELAIGLLALAMLVIWKRLPLLAVVWCVLASLVSAL